MDSSGIFPLYRVPSLPTAAKIGIVDGGISDKILKSLFRAANRRVPLLIESLTQIAVAASLVYLGGFQSRFAIGLGILAVVLVIAATARHLYATGQLIEGLEKVESQLDEIWEPQLEAEFATLGSAASAAGEDDLIGPIAQRRHQFSPRFSDESTIYIRGVELQNIRCFEHASLALEDEKWSVLDYNSSRRQCRRQVDHSPRYRGWTMSRV